MKRKYEVSQDTGFEQDSGPVREVVKSFKNETDALAFYTNPKNIRRYGTMYLTMKDESGDLYNWDDQKEMWQQYE